MPIGNPLYTYDDAVTFQLTDENGEVIELTGTVGVVDAYGIFADNSQVYYDIMVKPDPRYGENGCFYKHIPEDKVSLAQ